MGYIYKLEGKMKKVLYVYEQRVEIVEDINKRNIINYEDIQAIQYKACKLTAGYLRFVLKGDVQIKLDVNSASIDVNSVLFSKENNEIGVEILQYCNAKIKGK